MSNRIIFDGSGRDPWPHQKAVLDWIKRQPTKYIGLNLPTGTGKQAIARALQLEYGYHYITPNNLLIDQGISTYKTANFVKGREHYTCRENPDMSCLDMQEVDHTCSNCLYKAAKIRAVKEPSFFNPLSFYFYAMSEGLKDHPGVIVDEAHKLGEMMLDLGSLSLSAKKYGQPQTASLIHTVEWLKDLIGKLNKCISASTVLADRLKYLNTKNRIVRVLRHLEGDPEDFLIRIEDGKTICKPLSYPTHILKKIFEGKKVILMSATLPRPDVVKLSMGAAYSYYDLPHPIPVDQRRLFYDPAPVRFNWQTNPADIAEWIKKQLEKRPGKNTIVHLTYGWSQKLKPFFPTALVNTPETKIKVLEKFVKKGGLWLAAGCSEGIDLIGDTCRLNLIPMVYRTNIGDSWVKKRMAKEDGKLWYALESLKTIQQQVGRSTRGLLDSSEAVIGDRSFPGLLFQYKEHVPKSFLESIVWQN